MKIFAKMFGFVRNKRYLCTRKKERTTYSSFFGPAEMAQLVEQRIRNA